MRNFTGPGLAMADDFNSTGIATSLCAGNGDAYTQTENVQAELFTLTKTAKYSEETDNCTPKQDVAFKSQSGQDQALKEIFYSNPK